MTPPKSRLVSMLCFVLLSLALVWPVSMLVEWCLVKLNGNKVLEAPAVVNVSALSSESHLKELLAETTVTLQNITQHSVRVVGVQCSCGCISSIEEYPFTLEPNGKKNVRFQVQLADSDTEAKTIGNIFFFIDEPSPSIQVRLQAKN